MPNPAVTSAVVTCTFGTAPATLNAVRPNVLIEGRPAATITDIAPGVNIPPFGMCTSLANPAVAAATAAALGTLTPMPCTPVIVGPWTPTAATVLVDGQPVLAQGATAQCAFGGVISIVMPGAVKTQVG